MIGSIVAFGFSGYGWMSHVDRSPAAPWEQWMCNGTPSRDWADKVFRSSPFDRDGAPPAPSGEGVTPPPGFKLIKPAPDVGSDECFAIIVAGRERAQVDRAHFHLWFGLGLAFCALLAYGAMRCIGWVIDGFTAPRA
jgi:hypothetical protein